MFVVTGLAGGGVPYDIHPDDSEYAYFAETWEEEISRWIRILAGRGEPGGPRVGFVGTTTGYTDAFSIRGPK